jgi:hypothetical protein
MLDYVAKFFYYSFLYNVANRILAESQKDPGTGQRPVI